MSWIPKLHREFRIQGDADRLSHDLVSELRHHGVTVLSHYPGSRVIASVLRPRGMSAGQTVRVDFRPQGSDGMEVVVESRFRLPGVDFTHENEKNVVLIDDLLQRLSLGEAPSATAA